MKWFTSYLINNYFLNCYSINRYKEAKEGAFGLSNVNAGLTNLCHLSVEWDCLNHSSLETLITIPISILYVGELLTFMYVTLYSFNSVLWKVSYI